MLWRKNLDAEEWGAVRVVPCDDQWQFALHNKHWMEGEGPFPDEEFFFGQASAYCETAWNCLPSAPRPRDGARATGC